MDLEGRYFLVRIGSLFPPYIKGDNRSQRASPRWFATPDFGLTGHLKWESEERIPEAAALLEGVLLSFVTAPLFCFLHCNSNG